MEVIPAIDLRNGKVVRLYQGDFQKEVIYSHDPVNIALGWEQAGAPRIHVVDLDGAATGTQMNHDVLKDILARVAIPLQVGGGIRDIETATELVSMGVDRVVFGTAAVHNPNIIKGACESIGEESVVVGVDARDGNVAVHGWLRMSSLSAKTLMETMIAIGVKRFIYTDIATDGTLNGPNIDAVVGLVQAMDTPIISSGGIGNIRDLESMSHAGVEGVIIGSALYRGTIDLREAVERFGD